MAARPPPPRPLELSRFFRLLSSSPTRSPTPTTYASSARLSSTLPASTLPPSLHPVSRSRERCCVRYIVYTSVPSLNKLLFIRPVAEMNLRDSYRTRPDMHDGFESLSFPPNVFSEVIDRRMNVPSFLRSFLRFRNPRKINTREKRERIRSVSKGRRERR